MMNPVTIKDPTERWGITLSGGRGSYRLEANFDWLKQKELFGAMEKEYAVDAFSRTNFGSVITFRVSKEQTDSLVESVGDLFERYFIY
ncbi:MAG: hypothetical protein MSH18_03705 [Bacteroidales bacterium]|nr:hypothetical protein [Bacteroidales bacterium]